MHITKAETSIVQIPFPPAGDGTGIMPTTWNSLEFALVRLEDEHGNVGWGEGFGYFTVDATKAIIDRLLLPRVLGSTITDIRAWNRQTQLDIHLFGRYGITIFALSAVDIALWDLAAKRENLPLHELISSAPARTSFDCYASLMRYGRADLVTEASTEALRRGYTSIKLHETTLVDIQACRDVIGPDMPMSVDVNCQWSEQFVNTHRHELQDLNIAWLEEPIFPPEDHRALTRLRSADLPLAAGENWCTAQQFTDAGDSVDIWQPSVTKVGGISAYLDILELAATHNKTVIPHCPYFGPGFFATIHLAAVHEHMDNIEILFADPKAWLAPIDAIHAGDRITIPTGAGLGFAPDPQVYGRYRRA
ncbi:mandelate racemase/muconate lactonizing enzyme family protein [Mycolicibacterium sp. HK-90]|uniref:mandelate racemase/muconate lactonizing enzyme family protein n=1 Tax=Mycolicibacterium sp. HK-90 TaxID=3056937 RepID=UPI002659377A|nr:mandelate racemase/muconate lactonizing enzyme family protein [Mycolicibacterium sp. HK-90]WKG03957.1 mandelate racemase/muconate lactonizing enzyme family protein [Mycolicibacterium sp. HK-90]